MQGASQLPPATVALPQHCVALRHFDAAAATFDAACAAHDHARTILLNRLAWFDAEPRLVVDAGCGTGRGTTALQERFPRALVIGVDRSSRMLAVARRRPGTAAYLCSDVQALPLADRSADLLFANLVLPWCDPLAALREIARVLAPGGLLLLSTTGPKTLEQVRRAWRSVDDRIHVHASLDMQTVGDLIVRAGLAEPVLDTDCVTLKYSTGASLCAELRSVGAVNSAGGRRRSLTGRQRYQAYERALAGAAGTGDGIDISLELIFAQAFGRDGSAAGDGALPLFRGIPLRRE